MKPLSPTSLFWTKTFAESFHNERTGLFRNSPVF